MRGRGEGSIRQRQRKDGSVFWGARVTIHGRQKGFFDDTKSGAMAKARRARRRRARRHRPAGGAHRRDGPAR